MKTPPKEYAHALFSMLSFLDNAEYTSLDDVPNLSVRLLKVTDVDVYRYFCQKAYGTAEPGVGAAPTLCRSTTLAYYKKAISAFMPRYRMIWDEVRKEGNPTKSHAVNEIIKEVEKHEVRGTGIETMARRPMEWEEFLSLLVAARTIFCTRPEVMTLMLAVMTLQWHFIGRIDDIMNLYTSTVFPNLRHPGCLQVKMRKSKNIRSERDMPTQIYFGSMDPLVCPILNVAIHIEMYFSCDRATKRPIFGSVKKRGFTTYLEKIISSSNFKPVKRGKLGTHSLRKGPSTYSARFGVLREWISLRGRWQGKKQQVDTYIDSDVPFPDAKVASILCGPRGPCKYVVKEGGGLVINNDFFLSLVPRCIDAFGTDIAIIFARLLLWAAFKSTVLYNGDAVSIIPSDLQKKILDAWAAARFVSGKQDGADDAGDFNPIEKIGLLVSQRMDQLDIVPVLRKNDVMQDKAGGMGEEDEEGPVEVAAAEQQQQQVGVGGEEAVQNLSMQVFHLQDCGGHAERNELVICGAAEAYLDSEFQCPPYWNLSW